MIDAFTEAQRTNDKMQDEQAPRSIDSQREKAYKFSYLFNLETIEDSYLIDGTRYINIQLNYRKKWRAKYLSRLEDLCLRNNIIPVITPIEEYPAVHKNPRIVQELINKDCLITANVSSVFNKHNKRLVFKLIERDMIDVLVTDGVNDAESLKKTREALEVFCDTFGREKIERLVNNLQEVNKGADFERRQHRPFKKFLWFYY